MERRGRVTSRSHAGRRCTMQVEVFRSQIPRMFVLPLTCFSPSPCPSPSPASHRAAPPSGPRGSRKTSILSSLPASSSYRPRLHRSVSSLGCTVVDGWLDCGSSRKTPIASRRPTKDGRVPGAVQMSQVELTIVVLLLEDAKLQDLLRGSAIWRTNSVGIGDSNRGIRLSRRVHLVPPRRDPGPGDATTRRRGWFPHDGHLAKGR